MNVSDLKIPGRGVFFSLGANCVIETQFKT